MGQSLKRIWVYLVGCAAAAVLSPAQTFTTLANFDGTDGAYPFYGPLLQATNGSLYGTTAGVPGTFGTIFKITPDGALTGLHSFSSTDGAFPTAWLIQATNGYVYGTTSQGGANNGGTIFRITPAGALTTLYSFCAQTNCADGQDPLAGLLQAGNGMLYGTTFQGGAYGWGAIFEITPAGAFTVLHSFNFFDGEGIEPGAGLVQAADGHLYGTTSLGGANQKGTIFKITPSGAFTTLYSFHETDGESPNGLVQATNGDFYGTTNGGGIGGYGTVFKITPAGTLTTIHNFNMIDGAYPYAALMQATNGALYGTTSASGNGWGTIFEIKSDGLTTLHSFVGTDGSFLLGSLVQDTDGSLYGAADAGGSSGYGTVFKLSMGLGPFVKTLPGHGLVGSRVKILGSDLTGATSVTFNGVPAVFTVVSAREISTTVPSGATTGKVEVVTPSGTLVSNVGFFVP